jgi:hypothetical protein
VCFKKKDSSIIKTINYAHHAPHYRNPAHLAELLMHQLIYSRAVEFFFGGGPGSRLAINFVSWVIIPKAPTANGFPQPKSFPKRPNTRRVTCNFARELSCVPTWFDCGRRDLTAPPATGRRPPCLTVTCRRATQPSLGPTSSNLVRDESPGKSNPYPQAMSTLTITSTPRLGHRPHRQWTWRQSPRSAPSRGPPLKQEEKTCVAKG